MKISMPKEEEKKLKSLIDESKIILEYGSGGSTIYAGNSGGKTIITTENDRDFLEKVKAEFPHDRSRLIGNYVYTGKTKMWGYPIDDSQKNSWHEYPKANWTYCFEKNIFPDLIIVDGRFRVACFLYSLRYSKPGTRIFWDDYVNRNSYHVVEEMIKPSEVVGRAAIFIKNKESIDHSHIEKFYTDIR